MTQQIAVREDTLQELEESFAIAVRQRELLEAYIKERLTPGKHFYKMSGDQKNSLTKEGAELICLPHGYKPAYHVDAGPDQPPVDDTPYQITVRCTLMKGERFEGEGIGSASSHITKKTGERIVRQRDPGLRHNATLKMAEKSAYIAATLNATAASEFFTQDMEDDQEGESDARPRPMPDNRYACPKHKGQTWTKKTKDDKTWYSHKDGNGWCNMADFKLDDEPTQGPSLVTQEAPAATDNASSSSGDIKNWGDLYTQAQRTWGMKPADVHMVLGKSQAEWTGSIADAWNLLVAAKEQAAKA